MAEDVLEYEGMDVRLREDEEMDFFTELALHETERWIQAVTRKKFQYPDDFRKSLGNGILLCELLNCIKPGSVRRINKLPGPIAGLDNINVFLKACAQSFGLKATQLFDPSDLEDLSHRAISDEDEHLLKQEVDRRATNVAVTIFWLGKSVAGDSKQPALDTSAFSALVHSHGNKNVISPDSFNNDSWRQLESPVKEDGSPTHRHIRDSSYDSLGSYEPESESSFDDLDGSMPVRSDMKGEMKRYGSQGSLNRDLRVSVTSDTGYSDKNDSLYQSSPDLSQGSHAHTRSSSTDSAEGGYYGNHSRQSSGSAEPIPTRLSQSGPTRKTSSSAGPDPLQFVKVRSAQDLAKNAEKQIEITKEVNKMRGVVDSGGSLTEEPDWQSNFKNWKSKRRQSTPAFASVGEAEEEEKTEEKVEKSTKTYGQMMADRQKRRSLGPMSFYPMDDDNDFSFGGLKTETTITKTNSNRTESQPEKFTEKTIKITQKPNNNRGFGFTLTGGMEKKLPITIHRVSLGSAADVNELEFKDEVLSINGLETSRMTLAQVQGMVDRAVKRGSLELQIKRYIEEENEYDSMEEEGNQYSQPQASLNSRQSSKPSFFTYPTADINYDRHPAPQPDPTPNYSKQPTLQVAVSADSTRPRLMDQLVKEQQQQQQLQQQQEQEANNNDVKDTRDHDDDAEDSEVVEKMVENFSFSSHSMPKVRGLSTEPEKVIDMNGPPDETLTQERPTLQVSANRETRETSPGTVTVTEERSTISVTPKIDTPSKSDYSPVQMRRHRTPERSEAFKTENSPAPPTPPKAEPPPLAVQNDDGDDSGFGPPAALLRWQRPRAKSEYVNPFPSTSLDQQLKVSKKLSSTLPYNSKSPFTFDDEYSKDDSNLDKVSVDPDLSKSNNSLRNTYHFDDSSRMEEWQQKQEIERQEKFERDQARIRQQYEEEKKRAKEAEKKKQEEDQERLNSDKFLQSMETQIIQTKQEAASPSMEPIRPAPTEPKFSSEPMTIKLPSNSQGRQFFIDPRNMDDTKPDPSKPEYSFHVDLQSSAPPLRTLNQEPQPSQEEILERERQKIREEEMRKLEEEKRRWKEEQERKMQQEQEDLRREREQIQLDKERIAREKALLEQQRHHEELYKSQYTSPNSHAYNSPLSSSPASSLSHSPRSPPSALDPKHKDSKKAPPPTAPKPDKNLKARLTREDLLMMNRKPTPMTNRPEDMEDGNAKSDYNTSIREAPTKAELHSLNAVPKPKFHSSGSWMKEEEPVKERPFVIGKRSDIIHNTDTSNPQEHWLVKEAERRRIAEQNNSITAHAGPTKPSPSALVSRFRGDIEPPPRTNRYSYPSVQSSESRLSPSSSRPLSSTLSSGSVNQYEKSADRNVLQFSAKTQPSSYSNPSLSQTLPINFSFNANPPSSQDQTARNPNAPSGDSEAVIAVSGKQKCSHCGEELGFGAAMVIESLGLYYHVQCFRCCVCRLPLGNGSEGADVRVRVNKLHCKNCYSNDEGITYMGIF